MASKPLQLPAQLTGISSKADNSYSIRISTQELSPEAVLELLNYKNQAGWICFAPNKLQDKDIPKEPSPDSDRKTDSQRLRNSLFVLHRQLGGKDEEFEYFRHEYMERFINEVKAKLE